MKAAQEIANWVREIARLPTTTMVQVKGDRHHTYIDFAVPGEDRARHYQVEAPPARLGFADVAKALMHLGPGCGEQH